MASILDVLKRKGSHGNNIAEAVENLPEGSGGVPEAPEDDKIYGRKNKEWTEVGGGGGTPVVFTVRLIDFGTGEPIENLTGFNGYGLGFIGSYATINIQNAKAYGQYEVIGMDGNIQMVKITEANQVIDIECTYNS